MIATYSTPLVSSPERISNDVTTTTCYYIRKLLAKYSTELQSFVVKGAGLIADAKSDINHVLESLYLEEPDLSVMARELEVLVQLHRSLSGQTNASVSIPGQLTEVERRIFWILGLKREIVK
ncbi:hypothetical protein [Acaryochloris sp. IP29b_bin.137]|uniref:hypothetical protein n=1 Tax=Acaryochloris sp. IP29b_bin.137 TaxID=2969217 RepID=UPI002635B055|nr:hypothetical protein [Acaryochloris sp. IP29b_bin.137]